uniref:Uncharacterized protein n=1 Tax=Romanomermis culicivorax TaxID=13658 RepID=A0A915LB62_ROMCU
MSPNVLSKNNCSRSDNSGNDGDFSTGEKNSQKNSQQKLRNGQSVSSYRNQQQQQPTMKNQSADKHDAQDNGKTSTTTSSSTTTRLYRKRWAILAIFCCLSMSNAFQWIQYAIITSILTKFYGVNELAINWTSMIYMLTYIPLIFPATFLLDK